MKRVPRLVVLEIKGAFKRKKFVSLYLELVKTFVTPSLLNFLNHLRKAMIF
jgi:hypothetical protein